MTGPAHHPELFDALEPGVDTGSTTARRVDLDRYRTHRDPTS